jgi:hypothetical protein
VELALAPGDALHHETRLGGHDDRHQPPPPAS